MGYFFEIFYFMYCVLKIYDFGLYVLVFIFYVEFFYDGLIFFDFCKWFVRGRVFIWGEGWYGDVYFCIFWMFFGVFI